MTTPTCTADSGACCYSTDAGVCTTNNKFTDVCSNSGATTLTVDGGYGSVAAPFDIYLYDSDFPAGTLLNVSPTGQVTFGSTTPSASSPSALPTSAVAAVFPFWQRLIMGNGKICSYKDTTVSPNTFTIEWSNVELAACSDGGATSSLTFEVQFVQGSQFINMYYGSMSQGGTCTPSDLATGHGASVGLQGPTASGTKFVNWFDAGGTFTATQNTVWQFIPGPLLDAGTY
jgi:hypothetical protein